jgi:hypothetical protein
MAEEPEVEDHEFDQESIAAVGGLVLAGAFDCASFVDDGVVGVDHAARGMSIEIINGLGEGRSGEQIIAIDQADVFALGLGAGLGNRATAPSVECLDDFDARILGGVVVGDREGVIGGAIVPENQFKVGEGLGEDAFDRLWQIGFAVEDGGDEGNFWHGA